jgi:DNA excision repair protein ERCC-2
MKGFWSPVFLSATFFDSRGFVGSLGMEACRFVKIDTDPLERRCLTIVDAGVTTEYRKRGDEQFRMIASRLECIGEVIGGSIACFFPSYELLDAVSGRIPSAASGATVREARSMASQEQADLVRLLASSERLMLLGVMGGKFSEGEDFSSGSLSAVAVVGLPLPPPSRELSCRMGYLDGEGGMWAYDSLVIVPAVAKVVQSAGRLFRRKGQRGVVILMDRRFRRKRVFDLLPAWMKETVEVADTSDPSVLRAAMERHDQ